MGKNLNRIVSTALLTGMVTGTGVVAPSNANETAYAAESSIKDAGKADISYEYRDKDNNNQTKTENFSDDIEDGKIKLPAFNEKYKRVYEPSADNYKFGENQVNVFGQVQNTPLILSTLGKQSQKEYEDKIAAANSDYTTEEKKVYDIKTKAYLQAAADGAKKTEDLKNAATTKYNQQVQKARQQRDLELKAAENILKQEEKKKAIKKANEKYDKALIEIAAQRDAEGKQAEADGNNLKIQQETVADAAYNQAITDLNIKKIAKYSSAEAEKKAKTIDKRFIGWGVVLKNTSTGNKTYNVVKPETEINVEGFDVVDIKALYGQELEVKFVSGKTADHELITLVKGQGDYIDIQTPENNEDLPNLTKDKTKAFKSWNLENTGEEFYAVEGERRVDVTETLKFLSNYTEKVNVTYKDKNTKEIKTFEYGKGRKVHVKGDLAKDEDGMVFENWVSEAGGYIAPGTLIDADNINYVANYKNAVNVTIINSVTGKECCKLKLAQGADFETLNIDIPQMEGLSFKRFEEVDGSIGHENGRNQVNTDATFKIIYQAEVKLTDNIVDEELNPHDLVAYDNNTPISPSIYGGFFVEYGHTLRIDKNSLEHALENRYKIFVNVVDDALKLDKNETVYEMENVTKNTKITVNYRTLVYGNLDLTNNNVVPNGVTFLDGSKYKSIAIGQGDTLEIPKLVIPEGYHLKGWTIDGKLIQEVDGKYKIENINRDTNTVVQPVFTVDVVVKDVNNNVIKNIEQDYNNILTVEKGVAPKLENKIFNKWYYSDDITHLDYKEFGKTDADGKYSPSQVIKNPTVIIPKYVDGGKIVFKDPITNNTIKEEDVKKGEYVDVPNAPSKEGLSFLGWDKEKYNNNPKVLVLVDDVVTAKYFANVKFVDEQGIDIVMPQMVLYGQGAVEPTLDQKLIRRDEFLDSENKIFKGWDKDFSKVTLDLEVVALYSEKAVVTLMDDDGTELVIKDKDGLELTNSNRTAVKNKYNGKKYILAQDGNIVDISKIDTENAKIVIGQGGSINCPVPEGKYHSGLTFKYFEDGKGNTYKLGDKIPVNELNLELKANYGKTMKVTFKGLDGTYLGTERVGEGADGNIVTPPEVEGLKFKGWDQDLSSVKTDMIVSAIYEAEVTVEGKEGVQNLEYGTDTNTIPHEDKEGLTFKGWFDEASNKVDKITKNIKLKPEYFGAVIFQDPQGNAIKALEVKEGEKVDLGKVNYKVPEGQILMGWVDEEGKSFDFNSEIKKDTVLKAVLGYEVLFAAADGTVLKTQIVKLGEKAQAPTIDEIKTISKVEDGTDISWDTEIDSINKNITVKALLNLKKYKVTIVVDGKSSEQTVEYGKSVTIKEVPVKEGYKFVGWDVSLDNIREDRVITAIFEKLPEVKPGDIVKPGDTITPGDITKPGDVKPGDLKPTDPKPGDIKPGDVVNPGGTVTPGDIKPGDLKPTDPKPGDTKPTTPTADASTATPFIAFILSAIGAVKAFFKRKHK